MANSCWGLRCLRNTTFNSPSERDLMAVYVEARAAHKDHGVLTSLWRPLCMLSLRDPQGAKRAEHTQSSAAFAVLHRDRADHKNLWLQSNCPATARAGYLPSPRRSLGSWRKDWPHQTCGQGVPGVPGRVFSPKAA